MDLIKPVSRIHHAFNLAVNSPPSRVSQTSEANMDFDKAIVNGEDMHKNIEPQRLETLRRTEIAGV